MRDSFELFCALYKMNLIQEERGKLWWPNAGEFEVILGAILTQQTKWQKVEYSLENLKNADKFSIETIANSTSLQIAEYIKPSGFYNTKAKWLVWICKNINKDFGDFKTFQAEVTREWLLTQKGVGEETADSILCYACFQDEFVMDAYTARLLNAFGYDFDSYEALKEWMQDGVLANQKELQKLISHESLYEIYAYFHGLIVEYCKKNSKGKIIDIKPLEYFLV